MKEVWFRRFTLGHWNPIEYIPCAAQCAQNWKMKGGPVIEKNLGCYHMILDQDINNIFFSSRNMFDLRDMPVTWLLDR